MPNGNIDSRKEVLEYLRDIETHYATYHNHKETSAWAGLAVFVVLLPNLINALCEGRHLSCPAICVATFGVVVLTAIVLFYLHQQFALRRRGGDLVAASLYLRADYIANTWITIDTKSFAPPTNGAGPYQSSHCLARAVLDKANELGGKGSAARQNLEHCGYAMVLFISLLCVARLWIPTP